MLVKELQSLGLDITVYNADKQEIDLKQNFDEEDDFNMNNIDREVFTEVANESDMADSYSFNDGADADLSSLDAVADDMD